MTGDTLPADGFEAAYDAALDAASGASVDLASGGRLWFEPTQALVAIDLDSGGGGFEALLREAPSMIAYQLRLRALSGLIAIDVPRLSSGAAKTFTTALAAALDRSSPAGNPRTHAWRLTGMPDCAWPAFA